MLVQSKNNTKEYQSLIEINNLRLDYYRKNPELIIDSTDWQSVAICAFCYHKIPLDHLSLRNSFRDHRFQNFNECYVPKCPGCNYSPSNSIFLKSGTSVYSRIPYLVIRYRSHVIERNVKKNFFGKISKVEEKRIEEIEILEDCSKI